MLVLVPLTDISKVKNDPSCVTRTWARSPERAAELAR